MKSSTLVMTFLLLAFLCSPFASGRAWSGSTFTGKVVRVDGALETFVVKGRSATVTFDASRPVLRGYRSLAQMRVGDLVAVSYIGDGISIARQGAGGRAEEGGAGIQKLRTGSRHGLVRVVQGTGGTFEEVDANKDGKITPVGLSAVIPDLTMEEFKRYDTHGLGFLDREEFASALRGRRTK